MKATSREAGQILDNVMSKPAFVVLLFAVVFTAVAIVYLGGEKINAYHVSVFLIACVFTTVAFWIQQVATQQNADQAPREQIIDVRAVPEFRADRDSIEVERGPPTSDGILPTKSAPSDHVDRPNKGKLQGRNRNSRAKPSKETAAPRRPKPKRAQSD